MSDEEIDIGNYGLVASDGDTLSILNPRYAQNMSREAALALAAWLVVMADPLERDWPKYHRAVMNS